MGTGLTVTTLLFVVIGLLVLLFIRGLMVRVALPNAYTWWGCADLLSLGCLTAILVWRLPEDWMNKWGGMALQATGGALLVYAFGFTSASKDFHVTPTVVGLGSALFLTGSSFVHGVPPLFLRPITLVLETFGRVSYEIYIFHSAIRIGLGGITTVFLARFWPNPTPNAYAVSIALVTLILGFAMALAKVYTEPLNAAIRRLYREGSAEERPTGEQATLPV